MAKPEKKDKLKKWRVVCEVDGRMFIDSQTRPITCPVDPAHALKEVRKVDTYPQAMVLTSPDGTKWLIHVTDQGNIKADKADV